VIESFDDMGLKEDLLRGIYSYGFEARCRAPRIAAPTEARCCSAAAPPLLLQLGSQRHAL
jgi:hypothetical protein